MSNGNAPAAAPGATTVPAGVGAPAQGATPAAAIPGSPPGDPGQNQPPQVVTQEDVQRIVKESVEGATSKLWNDIKSMLGRTAGSPGQGTPQPAPQPGPGAQPPAAGGQQPAGQQQGQQPSGGNGNPDAIDRRLREMEQRMQAMQRAAVDIAIRDALQAAGVSGDALTLAQASFRQLHDGSIQVRDDLGNDIVVGDTNLRDYVKTWLDGQGKAFVPAKRAPAMPGMPDQIAAAVAAQGGVIEMTRAQAAKADPKLLKSGRVRIID